MTTTTVRADLAETKGALALLCEPAHECGLRVPKTAKLTLSGYSDDLDVMVRDTVRIGGLDAITYVTLSPAHPALIATAVNRVKKYAGQTEAEMVKSLVRPIPLEATWRQIH